MTRSFFQVEEFGRLQESVPNRGRYWLIEGILVVRQGLPRGRCWLWVPGTGGGQVIGAAFLRELGKIAKKERAVFCRIEPLKELKLNTKDGVLITMTRERYLPQDTLVLDLELSEDDLLKQMKPKGRYNIKIAEKHGIRIQQINTFNLKDHARDFDAWYEILIGTGERDGFGIHKKDFYKNLLMIFKEKGALFLAYDKEKVIGGILIIFEGGTATYYYGASDHEARKCMASYLLQWTAIREAKKRGMKHYDFLGIAPAAARGDSGEHAKNHPWAGVTDFKKKFGGREVHYPEAIVIVYDKFWYWLYRLAKIFRKK